MARTQQNDALDFFSNKALRQAGDLKPIGAKATRIITKDKDPLAKPYYSKLHRKTNRASRIDTAKTQKENILLPAHYKNVIKYFLAHNIDKEKLRKVAEFIEKLYNIKDLK